MILGIALLVTIISIIGCIKVKKSYVRFGLGILAAFCLMIVFFGGSITYVTRYRVNYVDSSISPDGKYELVFQQIGDPDWPFGHTHARLVLKDESVIVARYSFDLANDGGVASPEDWMVTWREDCAEAVISGGEQNDYQYILFFDGKKDSNQLDTRYGK